MNDESSPDPKDEPAFDPRFHITAVELRSTGIPVPEEIPGAAWTFRSQTVRGVIVRFRLAGPWGRMEATVLIPKDETKPCPTCSGTGGYGFTKNLRCKRCDGKGVIKANETPALPPRKECPRCEGRGFLVGFEPGKSGRTTCPECGGYGFFVLDSDGKAPENEVE